MGTSGCGRKAAVRHYRGRAFQSVPVGTLSTRRCSKARVCSAAASGSRNEVFNSKLVEYSARIYALPLVVVSLTRLDLPYDGGQEAPGRSPSSILQLPVSFYLPKRSCVIPLLGGWQF